MKTRGILILLVLLIGMINCEKEQPEQEEPKIIILDIETFIDTLTGINFISFRNHEPYISVKYDEIIGYDSAQHIFRIKKIARDRIADAIYPGYPDPHYGFIVVLDNEIIYRVSFIPPYYSESNFDVITFILKEPDLIFLHLGYGASPEHFEGEDLRNDLRIIEQLDEDNKLIELENFPYSG